MFKNFSPVHGIIIALGGFMIFILTLIFTFPMGKDNAELVSNNYYEDELIYQEVIDAKKLGDELSEKPAVQYLPTGVKITFPKDINIDNKKIDFVLFRTNDSNLDVKKEVSLDDNNSFIIPAQIMVNGSYTLKLKWKDTGKQYQLDYDILWK